jgi:SAM-dependent methyltransferase
MTQAFDKQYWESHWQQAHAHAPGSEIVANPYLAREISTLTPGAALDAGCGEGAEAVWLAAEGWQVIAVDISTEALARADERATSACVAPERVQWVEADLSVWDPGTHFDLVTTHYAHPAMPQLAFYARIAYWVAPRGTLLIVGHRHGHEQHGHEHNPPDEVSVTAASVVALLDTAQWDIVTADEPTRTATTRAGQTVELNDVVVRATRRA